MGKIEKLNRILKSMPSALIAFSGGVDSSFLCAIAKKALGNKVLAVTAVSETYPKNELKDAKTIAKLLGIKHKVIFTKEFDDKSFVSNPPKRCYYCKKELFSKLKDIAKNNKIKFILDASNLDDLKDYRPGSKAKKELGIRSPLQEAGLTKEEIRKFSKKLKLPTWNKPSLACLASRFAYGERLTKKKLSNIEKAENYLKSHGFKQVRVRSHGPIARVEIEQFRKYNGFQNDIIKNIVGSAPACRQAGYIAPLVKMLKRSGYKYITLDLEGFRSGSMNETL